MIIGESILFVVWALVITAIADHFFSGRTQQFIVFISAAALFVFLGHYNNRIRTKHLTEMWEYADQLGYGPAELKRRVPQYGVLDWETSRPGKIKFYPSDTAVVKLTRQF